MLRRSGVITQGVCCALLGSGRNRPADIGVATVLSQCATALRRTRRPKRGLGKVEQCLASGILRTAPQQGVGRPTLNAVEAAAIEPVRRQRKGGPSGGLTSPQAHCGGNLAEIDGERMFRGEQIASEAAVGLQTFSLAEALAHRQMARSGQHGTCVLGDSFGDGIADLQPCCGIWWGNGAGKVMKNVNPSAAHTQLAVGIELFPKSPQRNGGSHR